MKIKMLVLKVKRLNPRERDCIRKQYQFSELEASDVIKQTSEVLSVLSHNVSIVSAPKIVGTILNLINQGDGILGDAPINWTRMILTYMVPYAVSTYGAVSAVLARSGTKRFATPLDLECKHLYRQLKLLSACRQREEHFY